MLVEDEIFVNLFKGKMFLKILLQRIMDKREHGEKIECDRSKLILLNKWIDILQDYYDSIEDGVLPTDHNMDEEDAYELMAKIESLFDEKLVLNNVWLLQSQLNGEASFDDSLTFSENVEFS